MKLSSQKLIVALLTTVSLALAPALASAHGRLESAAPASNASVDAAPSMLRLTFNEDLEPSFSTIKVTDANGAVVDNAKAKVDPSDKKVLTLAVPKLSAGTYSVQWAVMTGDSHKTKGTYKFSVK
jgi:methionine-rich copper-binding protein CopC